MTDWMPEGLPAKGQRYLAIADAISRDIRDAKLKPGDRLPTHRELAYKLRLSVSTVSKAYTEAVRRQLISSEIGRGTYVLVNAQSDSTREMLAHEDPGHIDLGYNCPVLEDRHSEALANAFKTILSNNRFQRLLAYERPYLGLLDHREAGAAWLAHLGLQTHSRNVVVVSGAQHAGAVTLASIARPGDVILTEELTDPGMKFLCANLHLSLRGVPIDQHGIIPEAIDAVCRNTNVKALFCMPNHHSPTLAMMPTKRRAEIAEIAERYDFTIIENDVYGGYLDTSLPTLASFAPHRSYYFTSLSKLIAPGLRIGYLAAPPNRAMELVAGLGTTAWMAPLPSAEVATMWINDGTAARLAAWQRKEMARRQSLVRKILEGFDIVTVPTGLHVWMRLPSYWRADGLTKQARAQNIIVTPSEVFVVGHLPAPQAVRISVGGATPSRKDLETGLLTLRDVLNERAESALLVV